jgi:DNA invertase Pin-like site-specific DNA recombinase
MEDPDRSHGQNQKSIALYARVSTAIHGQDPEHQLSPLRQMVTARGYQIFEIYVDHGISGAKERRPALDRMINDARLGRFKVIGIYSLDRLGRNTRHLINLFAELEHYGVAVISIREGVDFTTPIGRTILAVFSAVAGLERELISERIKTALAVKQTQAKLSNSGWTCGRPKVVTAELRQEISSLRAAGLSIREIARRLSVSKSTVDRVLHELSRKRSP